MCKAHTEMQSIILQRGFGACPLKILKVLRLNLRHKISMLRTGSGTSAVRESSLAVHARAANTEGTKIP